MTAPPADIGAAAVKDADGVPDEKLAAAVLRMALDDLLEPQRCCGANGDPIDVLQEARQFCFSSHPESKQWREFWCESAHVDVSYFQRLAAQRCATYR